MRCSVSFVLVSSFAVGTWAIAKPKSKSTDNKLLTDRAWKLGKESEDDFIILRG